MRLLLDHPELPNAKHRLNQVMRKLAKEDAEASYLDMFLASAVSGIAGVRPTRRSHQGFSKLPAPVQQLSNAESIIAKQQALMCLAFPMVTRTGVEADIGAADPVHLHLAT